MKKKNPNTDAKKAVKAEAKPETKKATGEKKRGKYQVLSEGGDGYPSQIHGYFSLSISCF
jgi:hypothetical protein